MSVLVRQYDRQLYREVLKSLKLVSSGFKVVVREEGKLNFIDGGAGQGSDVLPFCGLRPADERTTTETSMVTSRTSADIE